MENNKLSTRLGTFLMLAGIYAFTTSWALAASAIYRCGPDGNQSYSQIPCEENSEQVQVEDHHMFTESNATGDVTGETGGDGDTQQDASSRSPEDNLKSFITQLEKQRTEQLAEVDRNIQQLQEEAQAVSASEGGDASVNEDLMASLQSARQSIVTEYEAMIGEAQRRLASQ